MGRGRPGRFAAFAGDLEDAVSVVVDVVADFGVEGFGDAQAAEGEQRDEGQRPGRVLCCMYKEKPELVGG